MSPPVSPAYRRWMKTQVAAACALRKRGVPRRKVARQLGVGEETVTRYIRLGGGPLLSKRPDEISARIDQTRQLAKQRRSLREIARRLGVDETTASQYLRGIASKRAGHRRPGEFKRPFDWHSQGNVDQIRRLRRKGWTLAQLAVRFDRSVPSMSRLCNGLTFSSSSKYLREVK